MIINFRLELNKSVFNLLEEEKYWTDYEFMKQQGKIWERKRRAQRDDPFRIKEAETISRLPRII